MTGGVRVGVTGVTGGVRVATAGDHAELTGALGQDHRLNLLTVCSEDTKI